MSRIPGLRACHMHGKDKALSKPHMSLDIHEHPAIWLEKIS